MAMSLVKTCSRRELLLRMSERSSSSSLTRLYGSRRRRQSLYNPWRDPLVISWGVGMGLCARVVEAYYHHAEEDSEEGWWTWFLMERIVVPSYMTMSLVYLAVLCYLHYDKQKKKQALSSTEGLLIVGLVETVMQLWWVLAPWMGLVPKPELPLPPPPPQETDATFSPPPLPQEDAAAAANANACHPRVNLSGRFKFIEAQNMDAFLACQGVSWALRKAAERAPAPTHIVTHTQSTLRIQVVGFVSGDTTFLIGGPPVETRIRDRRFWDTARYTPDGSAVQIVKQSQPPLKPHRIDVLRRLRQEGQVLEITSTVTFQEPGRESVQAVQLFRRIPD